MKRFLSVLITLVAVLALILGITGTAWAWGGGTWKVVASPTPDSSTNSSLSGVAAVSPHDVWAVGYFVDKQTETSKALIEHWNGVRWAIVASPNPGEITLNAVAAYAASDAWAVGATAGGKTLIEHWNGHQWRIIPSPTPVGALSSTLLGVTAISPHNAWAVGSYLTSTAQRSLIEHWNGHQWSIVPGPNNPSNGNQLRGVAAVSANDVWAVGIAGFGTTLVEHWNGSRWSVITSPNGSQFGSRLFGVTAISATNIWAVGNYSPEGGENPPADTLIEHWNGHHWSIIPSPNVSGAFASLLLGVTGVSARDVWAVGETISDRTRALIEHWNGATWQMVASPTGTSESSFRAVIRVPGPKAAWAVGDIFTSGGRFTLTAFHG